MVNSTGTHAWPYDVFISFSGEDTRYGFTGHLYYALCQKGFKTFIDEEIEKGDEISPSLLKSIRESRVSIVVFSRNYANSRWCLDELLVILECMRSKGQLVLPVFYKVDPSVVRYQTDVYAKAMNRHREMSEEEKVRHWRSALQTAANLSGMVVGHGRYEYDIIQEIVGDVSNKLNQPILHVAAYPTGLEYRVANVTSLLCFDQLNEVRVVGLHGKEGVGKSTIARAIYNLVSPHFEWKSFIHAKVSTSEKGLVSLQQKLLSDTFGGGKKIELDDVYQGVSIIRQRLSCKKVLLIIDDVDRIQQLQTLAGSHDWFGPGSRIITTTRNMHLLNVHNVIDNIYEVEELDTDEALELFSWHAFKKRQPDPIYLDISKRLVLYAECLPLALKAIGDAFISKDTSTWESKLSRYEGMPEGAIQKKLNIICDDFDNRVWFFNREIKLESFHRDIITFLFVIMVTVVWMNYMTENDLFDWI